MNDVSFSVIINAAFLHSSLSPAFLRIKSLVFHYLFYIYIYYSCDLLMWFLSSTAPYIISLTVISCLPIYGYSTYFFFLPYFFIVFIFLILLLCIRQWKFFFQSNLFLTLFYISSIVVNIMLCRYVNSFTCSIYRL